MNLQPDEEIYVTELLQEWHNEGVSVADVSTFLPCACAGSPFDRVGPCFCELHSEAVSRFRNQSKT
jgi:hypothetical protein